ncbi:DUF7268 family protein [Haloferax denitrificans]|uniref:Uncharacterized protein n=1 Tax=Haloferax denitrificans ATCC 35960 TaxID=662478 RepID=M0J1K8_9EURY|nr:hypothetical protein [Haloferax denitrificans]EMA01595.1 hypothetical protein C438_14601 [Haloferax denitrificans ATCC 35960]
MSAPPEPGDADADARPALERAAVRFRPVGTAALAGALVAAVWLAARLVVGDLSASVETTFALGSLAFGFGLLGWSGAVALGRGIESMQAHLDTGTGWTEADARRAMARILGFGLGVMLGATAVGSAVSAFVAAA